VNPSAPLIADERSARQVLLIRAYELDDDGAAPWTADDRAWATRVAQASLGDDGDASHFIVERARHAMQRLAPREPGVRAVLDRRFVLRPWTWAALLLGLVLGAGVDQIGPAQRINLLAPPIWLLVAWNLVTYTLIVVRALVPGSALQGLGRMARRLQALWAPRAGRAAPLQRFVADWARTAASLNGARAAWLLHLTAAALAAGLIGGLYLRGLVLDYRAGWESTFVDAPVVHAVLHALLAPASAVTGIAVPDVATLAAQRVDAGTAATAPAAPWLHLYAATLALAVVVPRLLLAALAAWQMRRRSRRWPLPWHEPYFQRLLQQRRGRPAVVWALPQALGVTPTAALSLQALLTQALGDGLQLRLADPVAHGDEDQPGRCTPPADATQVVVWVDLASTPEDEVQGRLLATLAQTAPARPPLLLVDESAFVRRFGAGSPRVLERRALWQRWAQTQGAALVVVDVERPAAEAAAQLRLALGG
jgi:hypothetical protein